MEKIKLVIDANILFSAVIKDSKTRELLKSDKLELYAPDFLISEAKKYFSESRESNELIDKLRITIEELNELISLLLSDIEIVYLSEYGKYLDKVKIPDEQDLPYLAAALAKKIAIWSNDSGLKKQTKVEIYTTKELLNL